MNELLESIFDVASGNYVCKPYRLKNKSKELNYAIEKLSALIKQEFPNLPNVTWVALRLLEGDQSVINAVKSGELGNLREQNTQINDNELISA